MYSETVLAHFQAPRNCGELTDPDAVVDVENPVCGDRLHLELRICHGSIEAARWRADGCVPAIAAASMISELLQGMTVREAALLNRESIERALGGLPPRKAHGAALAATAVRQAVDVYQRRPDAAALHGEERYARET